MTLVRFLFAYMFVLVGVEALLLVGGRRSDQDFFIGVAAALAGTIAWRVLAKGRAPNPDTSSGDLSRNLRPQANRDRGQANALHGSSPSR
jgi:hypothetical protein